MQWCTRAAHGSHRHTGSPCQTLTSTAAMSLRRLLAAHACGCELPLASNPAGICVTHMPLWPCPMITRTSISIIQLIYYYYYMLLQRFIFSYTSRSQGSRNVHRGVDGCGRERARLAGEAGALLRH